MSEQDNEYLEKLYAGFAMVGLLVNGDYSFEQVPVMAKALAKAMMEEDINDGGIATIKKRKYVRKD